VQLPVALEQEEIGATAPDTAGIVDVPTAIVTSPVGDGRQPTGP